MEKRSISWKWLKCLRDIGMEIYCITRVKRRVACAMHNPQKKSVSIISDADFKHFCSLRQLFISIAEFKFLMLNKGE